MPSAGAATAFAAPAAGRAVRSAAIAAVARSVPAAVVPSSEVAERIGVTEEWILTRTGVRERHIAAEGETVAALAVEAGRRALERAGVEAASLDLVLVGTSAADDLTPNAGPIVAGRLGAVRAGGMDIGAACNGFMSALALGSAQIESGRAERVLVIGSEVLSRFTESSDRGTAAIFADGAGAALLVPADGEGGIGPIVLGADADDEGYVKATHADQTIVMKGHDTFREAVRRLVECTEQVLERGGIGIDDVDLFVYHQANLRILAAVGEKLGLDLDRVVKTIDRFGNTSAATVPIALAEADRAGRLRDGDTVLLGAFGGGFSWGAGLLTWGPPR
ncbi:MAG: beta-ketoacyl-ACP synthase III [Solirubrobacterales bacterium]